MSDISDPNKRRKHLIIAIAVLVGAIILLLAVESGSVVPEESSGSTTQPIATEAHHASTGSSDVYHGTTPVRAFGAGGLIPPAPAIGRSPLADQLNDPAHSTDRDVTIVAGLFANYHDVLHALPVGTNAEITAALAGDNRHGHAPLPADHPAINAAGELTDRWGTPFFFHQLSASDIEIRSAGPDRRMHNPDDIVWPGQDETTVAALE